jgi:tRNA splicing endonuclease
MFSERQVARQRFKRVNSLLRDYTERYNQGFLKANLTFYTSVLLMEDGLIEVRARVRTKLAVLEQAAMVTFVKQHAFLRNSATNGLLSIYLSLYLSIYLSIYDSTTLR